jgi:hypothetical protein
MTNLIATTTNAYDNESYLKDTQYQAPQYDPLGNKSCTIIQNYNDRMRIYNLYQIYGLNDLNSQYNYYNSMEGFHSNTFREIYHAAYFNTLNPYIHNVQDANQKGEISDAVQVTGGTVEVLTGNANTLKLSENTKLTTKTDIPNQYGEMKLESKDYNFFINYNLKNPSDRITAGELGVERLQTGFMKKLPYSFTESITYGASTGIFRNTVGYELITHVGVFYDYTVGNNNNENVIRSGYGLKF